jgi:zinc transport system substrate-binding protein
MIKFLSFTILTSLMFISSLFGELSHTVLVSVAPYRFFVEQIAGDTVKVILMVPAGASAHTYEPSPRQMVEAAQADIWFRIGETFEKRAFSAIRSHRPFIESVDLRRGLDLINATAHVHQDGSHCCGDGMTDPHIWLSARMAQTEARTIAEALSKKYPEHQKLYQDNLETFLKELQGLDASLTTLLMPLKNRTIMVSHPAYAYFCRDYGLIQLSIEFEGKDPTPQQLTKTLNLARKAKVQTIYTQAQYSNKGALLMADVLGAHVVQLDPYAEDYLKTMRHIGESFANP